MKILIVGSNSIHVSSYVKSLAEKESAIYLLAEEKCDFDQVKEEHLVNFRSLNPISIVKNYLRLKAILKTLEPEIIHIHQINRLAYFVSRAASKLHLPIVSTAWGSDVLLIPFKNSFFRFLTTKTLQRSNFVTADANIMVDAMKKLDNSISKYQLLQYGIELVDEQEKLKIVYSNRLHKTLYRIDQIIHYFKVFSNNHSDWKLVIAGSGDQTDRLRELVNENQLSDKVEFVGWLNASENKEWYSKSKIYISIPESDGTSVSVLEAMSAGCIPVLSDLPVSHEWIVNNINGIIETTEENPLEKALELNFQEAKNSNKQLVKEKASRKACTDQFIELYKKSIGK